MEEREAIAKLKETTDYKYSHYTYTDDTGKAFDMAIKALEKQIEEQSTVYDVDKVVTELYDKSFERYSNQGMGGELVVNLDDAVETVKRGGI